MIIANDCRAIFRLGVVPIMGLVLSSCGTKGLFKMIRGEQRSLEAEARHLLEQDREEVPMAWAKAKQILMSDNLDLQRSQLRLNEVKRQRRDQWREWLPRPRLYLSLQSQLRDVSDLNSDDISKSLYAPLAIPNPVTLRARAYDYALREVQAEDSHEMARRRAVIDLYRTFMDWQMMQKELNFDSRGGGIEEEIQGLIRLKEKQLRERERIGRFWVRAGRLLNRPGVNIVPLTETAPDIDYSDRLGELEPGKNYGRLAYRLSSYGIVAALLRSKGIRIKQWPSTNVNAGFPAIYDSNRQDEEWLGSTDQINLFGSVNQSFDLTGRVAASIKSAEQQVEFIRASLKLKMDAENREWRRLKERYEALLQSKALAEGRLERALDMKQGDVSRDWDEVQRLFRQLQGIHRAKLWLDMELWLWDDAAWE